MRHVALCLVVILVGCVEDQRFIDEEIFVDSDVELFEDSDTDFDRDVEADLEPFDADELDEVDVDVEADVEVDEDIPANPRFEMVAFCEPPDCSDHYEIANTETTQMLFVEYLEVNPSAEQAPLLPVTNVSAVDAMRLANAMSDARLLPTCYRCEDWWCAQIFTDPRDCQGIRLPTEDEWEGAVANGCPPGMMNDCSVNANNSEGSENVAGKLPTAEGIYDMLGNVWELCHSTLSPTGFAARGGGWGTPSDEMRASLRMEVDLIATSPYVGFRLVRSVVD